MRCHVGFSTITVAASSDLLASVGGTKLHVLRASCWLGYSLIGHHFRPRLQWCFVSFWANVSHQPQEQSGRSLDSLAHLCRSDRHSYLCNIWLLCEGIPGLVIRQLCFDRKIKPARLHNQRSSRVASAGLSSCETCHRPSVAGYCHRLDHYCGCHLFLGCFCVPRQCCAIREERSPRRREMGYLPHRFVGRQERMSQSSKLYCHK